VILAGAIGATKTVLALCDASEAGVRIVRSERFASQELTSLDKAFDSFLRDRDIEALYGACFGVAGPVVDDIARVTNLGWLLDAAHLSKKFGIAVTLINDLQATALGSLVVPADKFAVLQQPSAPPERIEPSAASPGGRAKSSTRPPAPAANPPIAVLALGTGLGEATLLHDGKRYRAVPSEGGHADFAATTDDEIELLKFLRARHGHVSYERVLSGGGILEIYEFLRSRAAEREPTWLAHDIASGDPNAAIVAAALAPEGDKHHDACCVRAVDMFIEILGAEAGNIALRAVAGGVVIGGGIPHKLLPVLSRGALIKRFNDKGRFSRWMSAIGVRVLLEPRAAVLGAAHHAATANR
jgi:glucokinase